MSHWDSSTNKSLQSQRRILLKITKKKKKIPRQKTTVLKCENSPHCAMRIKTSLVTGYLSKPHLSLKNLKRSQSAKLDINPTSASGSWYLLTTTERRNSDSTKLVVFIFILILTYLKCVFFFSIPTNFSGIKQENNLSHHRKEPKQSSKPTTEIHK